MQNIRLPPSYMQTRPCRSGIYLPWQVDIDHAVENRLYLSDRDRDNKKNDERDRRSYYHRSSVNDCVYITPSPGAVFPSPISRQPRGCNQCRTMRLPKALGATFPTSRTFFGTGIIPTVEIPTMENRPRGGYIHRRVSSGGWVKNKAQAPKLPRIMCVNINPTFVFEPQGWGVY